MFSETKLESCVIFELIFGQIFVNFRPAVTFVYTETPKLSEKLST